MKVIAKEVDCVLHGRNSKTQMKIQCRKILLLFVIKISMFRSFQSGVKIFIFFIKTCYSAPKLFIIFFRYCHYSICDIQMRACVLSLTLNESVRNSYATSQIHYL